MPSSLTSARSRSSRSPVRPTPTSARMSASSSSSQVVVDGGAAEEPGEDALALPSRSRNAGARRPGSTARRASTPRARRRLGLLDGRRPPRRGLDRPWLGRRTGAVGGGSSSTPGRRRPATNAAATPTTTRSASRTSTISTAADPRRRASPRRPTPDARRSGPYPSPPMDPAGPATHDAQRLETALFEIKKVIVGQDRAIERLVVCLLARGHCLLEGVPGLAKTLMCETLARHVTGGTFARSSSPPTCCPPTIVGTRIYRASTRDLRRRAGPGVRQLRARRRDQPGAGQGAVGPARGHGRAPGVDRRQTHPGARAVPRARHPEPDRERGRLPAARGPARPVPHEGPDRLPDAAPRRPRSSCAWACTRRRPSRCSLPRTCSTLQAAADAVYVDRASSTTPSTWCSPPATPAFGSRRPRRAASQYGASPRASLGLIAAGRALALLRGAATCCPRTCSTWRPTCCATGSCSPTRRSPAASPPTTCWPDPGRPCRRRASRPR